MKVALIHDWLTGMRGGEKCLEVLCELFPGADLYTLLHLPGKLSPTIESMEIRTSRLQSLPFKGRYYRYFLPLFPAAMERFDLSGYDLVVSSSHCVAKGAVTGPRTPHLCYCFTPMRYAWDQYEHYFAAHRLPWWTRPIVPPLMERLRRWDERTAERVDSFAAISHYVAERIRKYYGRESRVIYPPVDVGSFPLATGKGEYYLTVSALAPYKRVDIAIEAFRDTGRELVVVGTGQDEARLRALGGGKVRFAGWLPPEELARAYRSCRALIYPAEEDFGIVPVEAQASGRPVIALGRGGVTETVTPHPDFPAPGSWPDRQSPPTGVFFPSQDAASLAGAVEFFESREGDFSPAKIRESVLFFDYPRFRREIAAFIRDEGTAREG